MSGHPSWRARRCRVAVLAAVLVVTIAARVPPTAAQSWPTKPVRLVVPFVPGGATDVVARLIVDQLSQRLGQPVVVDNRPGAGGNVGATVVAKAAPDGHTMFVAGSPGFPNAAALSKNPGFDPVKDFVPVALLATQAMLLAGNAGFPPKTLAELIAIGKKEPGRHSYGTPGIGTPHHLAMELFKSTTGADFIHVPYRGGAPMAQEVVSGGVPLMFASYVLVGPHLKTGKLKVYGASGKRPMTQAPEIKTIAEQGYPDFDIENWFGIVAPAATPKPVVDRMWREVTAVLEMEETRKKLLTIGYDPPQRLTPAELGQWIGRDVKRWGDVLRAAGVKPE